MFVEYTMKRKWEKFIKIFLFPIKVQFLSPVKILGATYDDLIRGFVGTVK